MNERQDIVKDEKVTIGEYVFFYKPSRSIVRSKEYVVKRVDGGRPLLCDVKDIVSDRGNWETFSKTVSDLLSIEQTISSSQGPFRNYYDFKIEPGDNQLCLEMVFECTQEAKCQDRPMSAEEIWDQLQNVQKWRNLIRTIELLKPYLS